MKPRRILLALTMGLATALLASAALAQNSYKPEYRLSLVLGPPTPWGQSGQIWADLVKERTQGRINIKLYPGVSLIQGDQTREFSAIRQGIIDMAVGSTINWSPQVKQLNLFSMPFLMPDYKAVDALTQGEVGKEIFAAIDKAGVLPLAWSENGYRELTNSKRAIRSPTDLKGMKIRVVVSPQTHNLPWPAARWTGRKTRSSCSPCSSCTTWARSSSPPGATWPTRWSSW